MSMERIYFNQIENLKEIMHGSKLKIKLLQRLLGFTLAEVLITLGIIGVVAALTIPALMNETQDKEFKEAAKEAFSKSSQAIQQMRNDEGGSLETYYQNSGAFKPVFMTYFKVIKDCGGSGCVPPLGSGSTVYTSLTGLGAETDYMDEGQFITADGMLLGIQNSLNMGIPNNLFITVDVNGYTKKPNVFGRDIFMFQVINDNLTPVGAKGTNFLASSYCNKSLNVANQGFGCMYNVMQGLDY